MKRIIALLLAIFMVFPLLAGCDGLGENDENQLSDKTDCAHSGGVANCLNKAICKNCKEEYGELDPATHESEAEWEITENTHNLRYPCCGAMDATEEAHNWKDGKCTECAYQCEHKGGTATCSNKPVCQICSASYATRDSKNHAGTEEWIQTETTHRKAYSCCGRSIISVEPHTWNDGVCSVCGYGCSHTGGTATCILSAMCSRCGIYYGSFDLSNHSGIATWTKTSTTHKMTYNCCNTTVVATENHHWSNGTCTECSYTCSHTGGTATCTSKAVCTRCGSSYGSLDSSNHSGSATWTKTTETHTKKYSCCNATATENHHWSNGVCSECSYSCSHTGGTATCTSKAVCTRCGSSYGSLNSSNHSGSATWTKTTETHTKKYSCCNVTVVATENHHWSNGTCSECSYVCSHSYSNGTCSYCGLEQSLEYTLLSNDTYEVSGIVTCVNNTEIVIPSTYNGKAVTSIGYEAFVYCDGLTSVTIPNSVTSIGDRAFEYCANLTNITIPNSVTSIGDSAFGNCSSLTSVTIGNSVTSIGRRAFTWCTRLTSITIPNSVTSIDSYAFENCDSLTSVTIGNSVTSIGSWAFAYCDSLTSVTIGSGVTSIGSYAFAYCDRLTSVTFANTSGWCRTSTSSLTGGMSFSSSALTNKSTAAAYLSSTYVDYYWYRK